MHKARARAGRRTWLGLSVVAVSASAATALVPGADAAAPTYYVDVASKGGACSDARTPAQNTLKTPWCSLATAILKAPAGSIVYVRGGSYPRATVTSAVKGSWVRFLPYTGETPTVAGMTLTSVGNLRFSGLKTTAGVIVRTSSNIAFDGGETALRPAGSSTQSGFSFTQTTGITVQDRYIHDGLNAVTLSGYKTGVADVRIIGNRMQRMGGDGVTVGNGARNVLIQGNQFIDVRRRSDMIPKQHSDAVQAIGPTTDVTIDRNVVRGGRGFLFQVTPADLEHACCGHLRAQVINNQLTGFEFAIKTYSLVNARIVNNTVWGTTTGDATGVNVYDRNGTANDRTTGLVLANNIMRQFTLGAGVAFAAREDNVIANGAVGPKDTKGVPKFEDVSSGDVGLLLGSVGVDAADPAYAPATDALGLSRYRAPDAGALELRP